MDFNYAKPSFFIENQLPFVVRRDGQKFISFLEKYYDFIERRVVAITLKSDFDISEDDISIGELVGTLYSPITTEDDYHIITEDEDNTQVFQNDYSLKLNGIDAYVDYDGSLFNANSSFTVTGWIKLHEFPSIARQDFDIITLSHTEYMSLFKIFKKSNYLGFDMANTEVNSGLELKKNEWNFFSIRYDASIKEISYDIKRSSGELYWANTFDMSSLTSDRFVVGCDLYNSRNFSDITVDEISIYNEYIANSELTSIYNNGTAIDLLQNINDYSSNNNLVHWFRFENIDNKDIALNAANTIADAYIYGDPEFIYESPLNIKFLITEDTMTFNVKLNVMGILKYDNVEDNVLADRLLVFAEHIYGNLEKDILIKNTPNGPILISDFYEIKNPLNISNNLERYQDVDYIMDYNNFIKNIYFIEFWKERMYGFPYFIYSKHENSIKDIIVKNIQDFYKSKGTLNSFKLLFKILYNETYQAPTFEDEWLISDESIDVEDEGLITDGSIDVEDEGSVVQGDFISASGFEYTIRTKRYQDQDTLNYINTLCHPVGYKLNLISN